MHTSPKGRIKRDDEYNDDDSEDEEDEEDSDGQFSDTIDEGEDEERGSRYTGYSHYSNFTATSAPFSLSSRRTVERRALEDRRLEEALLEYGESEIGYLSDADDEEVQGTVELEGDALFESVLDEYLQEKKDEVLVKGASVMSQQEIRRLVREQQIAQIEAELTLAELNNRHDDIRTCQEYLREIREELEWDCESVLSTYSTLDNHPALIKEPGKSSFRGYKNRHARQTEAEMLESASSVNGKAALVEKTAGALAPKKIELSGKLSLPVGFGIGLHGPAAKAAIRRAGGSAADSDGASIISALSALGLNTARSFSGASQGASRSRGVKFEERHQPSSVTVPKPRNSATANNYGTGEALDERDEDDDLEGSGEGEDDDNATGFTASTMTSRKGETAEQKKARKAAVKEERRVRRVNKKLMRDVYKEEGVRQAVASGRKQAIDNVSVFRY
jgi:hypothetical protein